MANTIDTGLYRLQMGRDFKDFTRTNTVASRIANIHSANKNETIEVDAYRSRPTVGTGTGFVSEVDVQSYTTGISTIQVTDFIYTAEPTDKIKDVFTVEDLKSASSKAMVEELGYAFDAKVIADALAAATAGTTAITDDATAQTYIEEVAKAFDGFAVKPSDVNIVINNNTMGYFRSLGATRVTAFGDKVLETGELYTYYGYNLLVVRKEDVDPYTSTVVRTILADDKALAVAGKALDVYRTDIDFKERQMDASAAGKVSLEDVEVRTVYIKTFLAAAKKPFTLVSA